MSSDECDATEDYQSDFESLELYLGKEDVCNLNASVYQMLSEGNQGLHRQASSHGDKRSSHESGSERANKQSEFSQCGWRHGGSDSGGSEMGDFGASAPLDLAWLLQRCDADMSLLEMVMEAFEDQGQNHCVAMSNSVRSCEWDTLLTSAVSIKQLRLSPFDLSNAKHQMQVFFVGSARNIGAPYLEIASQDLVDAAATALRVQASPAATGDSLASSTRSCGLERIHVLAEAVRVAHHQVPLRLQSTPIGEHLSRATAYALILHVRMHGISDARVLRHVPCGCVQQVPHIPCRSPPP
jgi:hypothetical protein